MSEPHATDDQIADMLHTLAECEAALPDRVHEVHRERLARIRWVLIGLRAGTGLIPGAEEVSPTTVVRSR